jgi:hypothetical protein
LPILKTAESISTPLPPNAPLLPWGSSTQWKEAHHSVNIHLRRYPNDWNELLLVAHTLENRLTALFPILDDLCINSCPWCPQPCCLAAKVWFDFKDLLFLHLNRLPIPLAQPINDLKTTCRYFSHRGCVLPRINRPWICTWYLCPVQTAILRKRDYLQYDTVSRIILEIKVFRNKLEKEFIRVVT